MSETETVEKRGPGRPKVGARGSWPKNRPERMSLGERGSLTYDPQLLQDLRNQGLTPRLVSDDPGRIDSFLRRGWKFMQDDGNIGDERAAEPGKIGGNAVKHIGGGKAGYLMVQPTEWYDEDQRTKQSAIDRSEEAMKTPRKGEKTKIGEAGEAYGPGLTKD